MKNGLRVFCERADGRKHHGRRLSRCRFLILHPAFGATAPFVKNATAPSFNDENLIKTDADHVAQLERAISGPGIETANAKCCPPDGKQASQAKIASLKKRPHGNSFARCLKYPRWVVVMCPHSVAEACLQEFDK